MDEKSYIVIGNVLKPHGLNGEIKILPRIKNIADFSDFEFIFINETKYKILKVKYNKKYVVLKLEGITDIRDVERIRNFDIKICKAEKDNVVHDEFYYDELIGLKVFDINNEFLGIIDEILELPANDVLVVKTESGKEMLLPYITDVIKKVDNEKVIAELLDGM